MEPLVKLRSNSTFAFFVRKQARNRAQGAPGGRASPLKDALRKVVRDLRARVRTNEDAKIKIAASSAPRERSPWPRLFLL
ncbi:MAG: hypothetical protein PHG96_14635, partial [Kiritimatiellae bacterium]|nr:hypothetical protein [Kiritimatiellia bacterium]